MIFERSLIREFSLVALAGVVVLLAIILTRLLILLLGKAALGTVLPEAVIGLIAFGILTYLPVLLSIAACVAVLANWPAVWYFKVLIDRCTENAHCAFTGAMLPAMPIALATISVLWPRTLPIAAVPPNTVLA